MELNELYSLINDYVNKYNRLSNDDTLYLIKLKKEEECEQQYDVSNLYVCLIDQDKVGLFKKSEYQVMDENTSYRMSDERSETGYIYLSTDSAYLFLERTNFKDNKSSLFLPIGSSIIFNNYKYTVNCNVDKLIPIDEFRNIMVNEKIINNFNPNYASENELLDVLNYASEYYFINEITK